MRRPIHLLLAALLGVLAAVLVSCGSSGTGLIPAENAGPLLADFQAVERAAKAGDGSCSATEAAIRATERDLQRLPAGVDAGLHGRLQEGVSKLRELALETCAQPQTTATAESTSPAKTVAPPTTTPTQTTSTSTTETTSTTATTPGPTQTSGTEGGTAPGVGGSEGPAAEAGGASGQGSSPSGSGEGASKGGASGGTGSGAEQ